MLVWIIVICMFHTKLCTLTWSINHLWIVIVSLGVNLMSWSFIVPLICFNRVLNCLYHLLAFLNYLTWNIILMMNILVFKILKIVIARSNNSFLRIDVADIIVTVSFSTCNSVYWSAALLVCKLNQLLWILVLHHHRLLCFRSLYSILIKWNMNSPICVSYQKNDKLNKINLHLRVCFFEILSPRFDWMCPPLNLELFYWSCIFE